jgi:hypothetical protein
LKPSLVGLVKDGFTAADALSETRTMTATIPAVANRLNLLDPISSPYPPMYPEPTQTQSAIPMDDQQVPNQLAMCF